MHVRGAQLQGFGHHLVDEAHDRRVLGGVGQVQLAVGLLFQNLDRVVVRPAERLQRVRADAQVFLDEAVDLGRGSQDRMHVKARGQAQLVQAGRVEDVAGDHRHPVAVAAGGQGHQLAVNQDARREFGQEFLGRSALRRILFQIDIGDVVIGGQRTEDFFLRCAGRLAPGVVQRFAGGDGLGDLLGGLSVEQSIPR